MICFGYYYLSLWDGLLYYVKYEIGGRLMSWYVLPLLGEFVVPADLQELFDRLDSSIYKF